MIATFPLQGQTHTSSRDWASFFTTNTQRWDKFVRNLELEKIQLNPDFVDSIKTFQLGEQSEGRTLLALATKYAQQHNDPDYLCAIQQFIKEEQRHAYFLAEALQVNDAEPIQKQWTDGLFRKLRKLCGLETMISVLLTAEEIAIASYSSASYKTKSPTYSSTESISADCGVAHGQFAGHSIASLWRW